MNKKFRRAAMLGLVLGVSLGVGSCDTARSVRPTNRSPVIQSLVVFPTTIGPGDSAIVLCMATDPDGDTLVYDWFSDCRIVKKGSSPHSGGSLNNQYDPGIVVYPGQCMDAPIDTGWISCGVRDRRGGGSYARIVHIIVRQ